MMSQLPPELDVEKMVAAALVGGGAGAAAAGRKARRVSNGRPSLLGVKHEPGHEEEHAAGGGSRVFCRRNILL